MKHLGLTNDTGPGAGPMMSYRGAWAASTTYYAGDIVANGGVLYVATATIAGAASFAAGSWTVFASGTGYVDTSAASTQSAAAPTGTVHLYAGAALPTGYLYCTGAAVSRTTYAALYAALGGAASPWGQGDGSTTFNLPNFANRMPRGSTIGVAGGNDQHQHGLGSGYTQASFDTANKQLHIAIATAGTAFTTVRTLTGSAAVVDSLAGTTGAIPLGGTTDLSAATSIPAYTGVSFIIKY